MCFPSYFGCRCCECQQKYCMLPHPGHSHREPYTIVPDILDAIEAEKQKNEPTDR